MIVDCPSLLVDCCLNVTAAVFVVLVTATAAANGAAVVVVIAIIVSSGVALSPRLASSPEGAVVVAERVPSGVALLPSGVALSPKRGVVVIVAAIDDRATTKQCFVGVGSGSRGDSKREQVVTSWEAIMSGQGP